MVDGILFVRKLQIANELVHHFDETDGLSDVPLPEWPDQLFPFLLVVMGSGVSIVRVQSPTSWERVGGAVDMRGAWSRLPFKDARGGRAFRSKGMAVLLAHSVLRAEVARFWGCAGCLLRQGRSQRRWRSRPPAMRGGSMCLWATYTAQKFANR